MYGKKNSCFFFIGFEKEPKIRASKHSVVAGNNIPLSCPRAFSSFKVCLKQSTLEEHFKCWNTGNTGQTKKLLRASADSAQTGKLLLPGKRELSNIVGVITGHISLRSSLQTIGKVDPTTCRTCAKDDEMLAHYLSECPAFSRMRRDIFHGAQS